MRKSLDNETLARMVFFNRSTTRLNLQIIQSNLDHSRRVGNYEKSKHLDAQPNVVSVTCLRARITTRNVIGGKIPRARGRLTPSTPPSGWLPLGGLTEGRRERLQRMSRRATLSAFSEGGLALAVLNESGNHGCIDPELRGVFLGTS